MLMWRIGGMAVAIVVLIVVFHGFKTMAADYAARFKAEDGSTPRSVRVGTWIVRVAGGACVIALALLIMALALG